MSEPATASMPGAMPWAWSMSLEAVPPSRDREHLLGTQSNRADDVLQPRIVYLLHTDMALVVVAYGPRVS